VWWSRINRSFSGLSNFSGTWKFFDSSGDLAFCSNLSSYGVNPVKAFSDVFKMKEIAGTKSSHLD